jgi:hypothetical protein
VAGELYIAGAQLARGYVARPELTAERFVACPYRAAGERMYRTGDRVRWLPDGSLAFLGRTDSQVKVRGHRIEPREIETLLVAHPRIGQAVVSVAGDELTAHMVASGPPPAATAVHAWLRERLPAPMVPTAYAFVDEWPLTPNGKLDRAALPPARRVDARPSAAGPSDAVEQALCRLWELALGVPEAGADDDFFERGGHSLLAARVVTRVRDAFGLDLPLRALFERPTPTGVAELVRRGAGEAEALRRAGVLLEVLTLSDDEVETRLTSGDGRGSA